MIPTLQVTWRRRTAGNGFKRTEKKKKKKPHSGRNRGTNLHEAPRTKLTFELQGNDYESGPHTRTKGLASLAVYLERKTRPLSFYLSHECPLLSATSTSSKQSKVENKTHKKKSETVATGHFPPHATHPSRSFGGCRWGKNTGAR